jgi:hypothetical protein
VKNGFVAHSVRLASVALIGASVVHVLNDKPWRATALFALGFAGVVFVALTVREDDEPATPRHPS